MWPRKDLVQDQLLQACLLALLHLGVGGSSHADVGMWPRAFSQDSSFGITTTFRPGPLTTFCSGFMSPPLHFPCLSSGTGTALKCSKKPGKASMCPLVLPWRAEKSSLLRLSGKAAEGRDGENELAGVVQRSILDRAFVKASFSEYMGSEEGMKAVHLRLVKLKRGTLVQALMRYQTNDQTKNHPLEDAGELVKKLMQDGFRRAAVFTTEADYKAVTKDGHVQLTREKGAPSFTETEIQDHDRKKIVPVEASSDFLRALGVSNAQGKPKPGMADKLRQIQKFVSIVDHLVENAGLSEGGESRQSGRPLRIIDMGCGKGYLTFATHVHFASTKNTHVLTQGVEMRPDLVEKTNEVAQELDLSPASHGRATGTGGEGLIFVKGCIADHALRVEEEGVDVLVALHACDTATDDAIFCGVRAGARVIITAPCCHKEIRRQIEGHEGQKRGVLQDLFRHGILREREAESITDTVRALLLEIAGYKSTVFEFIGGEHTAKNTMISAVKADKPVSPEPLRTRLAKLMDFYGLKEQHLAALMGELPKGLERSVKSNESGKKGRRVPVPGGSVKISEM